MYLFIWFLCDLNFIIIIIIITIIIMWCCCYDHHHKIRWHHQTAKSEIIRLFCVFHIWPVNKAHGRARRGRARRGRVRRARAWTSQTKCSELHSFTRRLTGSQVKFMLELKSYDSSFEPSGEFMPSRLHLNAALPPKTTNIQPLVSVTARMLHNSELIQSGMFSHSRIMSP